MKRVLLSVFVLVLVVEGSLSVNTFVSMPPTSEGRMLTECAGRQISLTCSHDNVNTGGTIWIASPPVNCTTDISHIGDSPTSPPCGPFMFQHITPLPVAQTFLNSTAIATTTMNMTGTNIECRGGNVRDSFSVGNISLCVVGQLPPPTNLTCESSLEGLNVSWEAVTDTSCAMREVEYLITAVGEVDMTTIISSMPVTETTTELTNAQRLEPNTTYIIYVEARTLVGSCDGEQSSVMCRTSASLPIVTTTTQLSFAPTTESSLSPTSSSGPSVLPTGAIAGIAIGCIAILAFVTIIVIVIIIRKFHQDGNDKSDQGIHAPLAADAEQQQLPVYAMVDKSKKVPAEQPAYQDPAKIQHETTASGDVYAVSDKRGKSVKNDVKDEVDAVYTEVDKSKKNQGLTYAAIQVDKGLNSGKQQQPTGVLYSDIQHQ